MSINNTVKIISSTSGLFLLILIFGSISIPTSVATSHDNLIPEVSVSVTASASSGNESIWILPGPRSLDPAVWGTPANPLRTNQLPTSMRNTTSDGSAYTTTAMMGPFSNKSKSITGSFSMDVKDVTLLDDPNSKDEASVNAKFTDPMGKTNYEVILEKLILVGPDHPFFGGVGTNILMHGTTEIGTPLMPTSLSYVTLWGFGDLYVNGTKTDSNRMIHVMLSQRLRNNDFQLGTDPFDKNELEIHLILPNTKITTTGPIVDAVPTQFILPNGATQPFLHINYYNIQVNRSTSVITETGEISTETITTTKVSTSTTTESTPGFSSLLTIIALFIVVPVVNTIRRKKQ